MTCHMNLVSIGVISELAKIHQSFKSGQLLKETIETSNKEDVWGWSVEGADNLVSHPNWLDKCQLSLSPTGELMALTYRQNMAILTPKWDNTEESSAKTKYHMVWNGDPCQELNESITCVCVLPMAAPQTQKSSHSVPDWTCIALGFSSGALRFYTEKGDLLLSEVLGEGPVVSIKCQTMSSSRYSGQPDITEELHVCYNKTLLSIYGFVLSNTLRACRNQLARVQANCSDSIVAPPLSLHKWSLPDQDNMMDCAVGLPQCPSAFTHLHIASVCGGFHTWYKPSPPQSSLVVAAGNKPFVGFHFIVEGSSAPVLTDVVKAVGTKLKSAFNQAVPSWFLGGRKASHLQEKDKVLLEPPEPMSCRFGLCDLWRQGSSVIMSPQRNLCVVTDTLGRVTLVDNSSGLAVRMWKGYRDAQCGWLVAEEEQNKGRKRTALFLVIYAPKKGTVEVWAMQQGPRVATITTSKNGRLFYIGHGLLGVSTIGSKNANRSTTPCVFMDEFGVISEITVPFHCALSDKNSKRARDVHLLRKLRQLLKEGDADSSADNVAALCRELQTNAIREQALNILASSRNVSANTLLEVVESFLHGFETRDDDDDDTDSGRKPVMQRCLKLQKLLIFFLFCCGLQQKPPDYETVISADSDGDLESLCEFLRLSREDTLRMLRDPDEGRAGVRVKFQEGLDGLAGYLAGFRTDSVADDDIRLANNNLNLTYLSEVVCGAVEGNVTAWASAAADSGIHCGDLLRLAVASWLGKRTFPSFSDTMSFGQLLTAVCNLAGERVEEPLWWEEVRSLLRESANPQLAVVAAVTCKAVAITFEEASAMSASAGTDDSESKTSDWEKVTQESCAWSLLISQLEDVALINSVLKHKPECPQVPTLHCLPYDPPELSLHNVCSKGRGCVSELVAKWLASCGLDPTLLLDVSVSVSPSPVPASAVGDVRLGVAEGQSQEAETGQEAKPTRHTEARALYLLSTLRKQFPYSLADSVLLANISWEYVLAWTRQVDDLDTLQAAIHCLRVIPSAHLRQGMCTLMWSMHLRNRFESTIRLINKLGKVPKERLCRQDVGLSELQIADFFSLCSDFFEIFMESRALSEQAPKEKLRHEAIWESSPVPPLQQLALDQSAANYDTLLLLFQCAKALHLLTVFSLRTPRPLAAFFDSVGQSALFADISAHVQPPSHVVPQALTQSRSTFLMRAVSAAIFTVTRHQGEYNMVEAAKWMKQCFMLAADWSISADSLRRQQCYELYAHGYDRLGEEVIPSVNETSLLGSQLMTVVGNRLRLSMAESNTQLREQVAHMSPALTTWISSLSEAKVEQTSLADTLELVVMISSLLEEDTDNKRIAALLIDSLAPIVHKGNANER